MTALLLVPSQAAAENAPPVITNATISPGGNFPYTGGSTTVSADVTDDVAATQVFATVIDQGGSSFGVDMKPTGVGNGYSGKIDFPPNFTNDPFGYQVVVSAIDGELLQTDVLAGEVQVDGQPQFDEKPLIGEVSVDPRALGAAGGPVGLKMAASDTLGLADTYAVVTAPGGAETVVPLEGIDSDHFVGTFNAPANTSVVAKTYSVQFSAIDSGGQQTLADGGTFTVAGQPSGGPLTISPASWSFGSVKLGKRLQHPFVVRNTGAKGSKTLDGSVSTSGAPFFVADAGTGALRFHLAPGQSKTFHVDYRPTAAVKSTGEFRVRRDDGGQSALAAKLSGAGLK